MGMHACARLLSMGMHAYARLHPNPPHACVRLGSGTRRGTSCVVMLRFSAGKHWWNFCLGALCADKALKGLSGPKKKVHACARLPPNTAHACARLTLVCAHASDHGSGGRGGRGGNRAPQNLGGGVAGTGARLTGPFICCYELWRRTRGRFSRALRTVTFFLHRLHGKQ